MPCHACQCWSKCCVMSCSKRKWGNTWGPWAINMIVSYSIQVCCTTWKIVFICTHWADNSRHSLFLFVQTGGKQFRLEYKNFYSLDLAKDGTGQVYNTKTLGKMGPFCTVLLYCLIILIVVPFVVSFWFILHRLAEMNLPIWGSRTRKRICPVISTQRSKRYLSSMIHWRRVPCYTALIMVYILHSFCSVWISLDFLVAKLLQSVGCSKIQAPLDGHNSLKLTASWQNVLVASMKRWFPVEHSRWWTIQEKNKKTLDLEM